MKTAIIFHLNYEAHPIVKCRQLWSIIETSMLAAGFSKSGRIFVTQRDSDAAFKLAREVMDRIEQSYQAKDDSAMAYLRDFYGIPYDHIVDLAQPSMPSVEVDMMASGAFQKFFGQTH